MATRAVIGKYLPDGRIRYVELLNDGYPEHAGTMLRDNYSSPGALDQLLDMGDVFSLGKSTTPRPMDMDVLDPDHENYSVYARDMRIQDTEVEYADNINELTAGIGNINHIYLQYEDGLWMYMDRGNGYSDPQPLEHLIGRGDVVLGAASPVLIPDSDHEIYLAEDVAGDIGSLELDVDGNPIWIGPLGHRVVPEHVDLMDGRPGDIGMFWYDEKGEIGSVHDIPAIIIYSMYGNDAYIKHAVWMKDGKLHREGRPAHIEWNNSMDVYQVTYFQDGKLHRDNGPAVIDWYNNNVYYQNGEMHRDDGPAFVAMPVDAAGERIQVVKWYRNGVEVDEEGNPKEVSEYVYKDPGGNYKDPSVITFSSENYVAGQPYSNGNGNGNGNGSAESMDDAFIELYKTKGGWKYQTEMVDHIPLSDDIVAMRVNVAMTGGVQPFVDEDGYQYYYDEEGWVHRDDGPAIIEPDGDETWMRRGLLHRDDGPAINLFGQDLWFIDGHQVEPFDVTYPSQFYGPEPDDTEIHPLLRDMEQTPDIQFKDDESMYNPNDMPDDDNGNGKSRRKRPRKNGNDDTPPVGGVNIVFR